MTATSTLMRPARSLWGTTLGKKIAIAVTGLILLLFLIFHMLGNLEIFFGASEFDHYAAWLRTIGEPVLHNSWYLWIQRAVLLVSLVVHVTAAVQLTLRDLRARPVRYAHRQRSRAIFVPASMRYGGIAIALFIVWHMLDLTVGVVNPDFEVNNPYRNVVADFQVWWIDLIYILAVVLLGLHINHGFRNAVQTLGFTSIHPRVIKVISSTLAAVITLGFVVVPIGVMTGLVS